MKTDRSRVLLALGSLYVIWGSTFLGIRIALEGFPPLMLAGLRFAIAGGATYAWVRARRSAADAHAMAVLVDRRNASDVRERLRGDRRAVGELGRCRGGDRVGAALGGSHRRPFRAVAFE